MAASIRKERTGYEEGFVTGCESGKLEGSLMGIEKGGQIGLEIGFYAGYVAELKILLEKNPSITKTRAVKTLDSLSTMITKFPLEDVLNQTLFEELETIRAKFKQLIVQLGISLHDGEIDQVKGVSF